MTHDDATLGGRLPLLDPTHDDADQKALRKRLDADLMPWAKQSGFQAATADGRPIGPFNAMLTSPTLGAGLLAYLGAEREHTSLSPKVREVIILTVGHAWRCAYELYAHTAVAKRAGLDPLVVDALATGRATTGLTDEEQLAHDVTRSLVVDHRIDATLYARATQQFGDRGVIDLVHLATLYLGTSALLNAFEVPTP